MRGHWYQCPLDVVRSVFRILQLAGLWTLCALMKHAKPLVIGPIDPAVCSHAQLIPTDTFCDYKVPERENEAPGICIPDVESRMPLRSCTAIP